MVRRGGHVRRGNEGRVGDDEVEAPATHRGVEIAAAGVDVFDPIELRVAFGERHGARGDVDGGYLFGPARVLQRLENGAGGHVEDVAEGGVGRMATPRETVPPQR